MNEQDYKYLLVTYQQRCVDMLSQAISFEAKIKQLNDVVEMLNKKITEQQTEIDKLKKPKRYTKSTTEDF